MTKSTKRPIALIIMDGYGMNPEKEGNAVLAANTPNLDSYVANYPHCTIHTSGMDVGLPRGQMGNSEVGHTNLGAGRVVYQELTRVTKEIEEENFFEKKEFLSAIENCIQNGTSLHLLGLLSDGGVHSHNTHLYALLELAKKQGLEKVFVHCFFDGRDVPPDSALGFTMELEDKIKEIGVGTIASIMGRYYAMDRDNRWDRVKLAYDAMVLGQGNNASDAVQAVKASYDNEVMDEFVLPTVITKDGKPLSCIDAKDSVIFFNFRPDRAREITRVFMDPNFNGFERAKGFFPLNFVCMTQYDITFLDFPGISFAYLPENLDNTFGEVISRNGLTQLRIAETEKYAHVTFFFNGGVETEYPGEDRALISSPKVATYDLKPEMSAYEVAKEAVARVNSSKYDVIVLNFANCDMVGHTGFFDAAVKAVETVDKCVGDVVDAVLAQGGIALLTADHGNAEQMIDPVTHGPFTAHTTLPVSLTMVGADKGMNLKDGKLADIAPTMLSLLGIEKPVEMTGKNLIC